MLAGHIGVAMMIGRTEREVNVGVFVAASLLLDIVLWLFILLGWESVNIPANFGSTHQPEFVFPYSHGLTAGVLWSVAAAALAFLWCTRLGKARWRIAALVAATVFSHWVLDALVHRPEMPLAGAASETVGFGLWNSMPIALAVESALVLLGVFLFISGSVLSFRKSVSLAALSLVILAFTVAGMTIAPPPPSATALAASSLLTIVLICALACWLGRLPR